MEACSKRNLDKFIDIWVCRNLCVFARVVGPKTDTYQRYKSLIHQGFVYGLYICTVYKYFCAYESKKLSILNVVYLTVL